MTAGAPMFTSDKPHDPVGAKVARRLAQLAVGRHCPAIPARWHHDPLSEFPLRIHVAQEQRPLLGNGDKYKTGKIAPDGSPDPSIFSSPEDPVGIQVGTAITTLVRKGKDDHAPASAVGFRHLWGEAKRAALAETAEDEPDALYDNVAPLLPLGLPFAPTAVSPDWFDWPALPDLLPRSHPGVKSGRTCLSLTLIWTD